jgi:23S rRNA (guanosine2251-2'-O)-methyltransferase
MSDGDSAEYRRKKNFFNRVVTIYGRKPVLEALLDSNLDCYRLHLADSNKAAAILDQITALAQQRGTEILIHNKRALSRISRNGKQDQGVAADILCPRFSDLESFLAAASDNNPQRLLALDGITNPANVGMIIRSAVAGGIDGIVWSRAGNADLGPLVIKASAGTLFRAPLIFCDDLPTALQQLQQTDYRVLVLNAEAKLQLGAQPLSGNRIYVLGNESEGVSAAVEKMADADLSIPMSNGVESLNVAVSAALIAYLDK